VLDEQAHDITAATAVAIVATVTAVAGLEGGEMRTPTHESILGIRHFGSRESNVVRDDNFGGPQGGGTKHGDEREEREEDGDEESGNRSAGRQHVPSVCTPPAHPASVKLGRRKPGHAPIPPANRETSPVHARTSSVYARTFSVYARTSSVHARTFSVHARTFSVHARTFSVYARTFSVHASRAPEHRETLPGTCFFKSLDRPPLRIVIVGLFQRTANREPDPEHSLNR
jgi:hypothetical protein